MNYSLSESTHLLEQSRVEASAEEARTRQLLRNPGCCKKPVDRRAPGAKDDGGKLLAGLVLGEFKHALREVVKVGTAGALKYSPRGWLQVPQAEERYYDALWRHLLATEEVDEELGTDHLAMVAWNALALLEFKYRRLEK
jgi:hypothetical protein